MKKINDSYTKAQSGNTPLIVSYFLSTLISSGCIALAGYLEIWILGTGQGAADYLAAYAGVATIQAWVTAVAYFIAMGTGCVVGEATKEEGIKKGCVGLTLGLLAGLGFVVISLSLKPEWVTLLGAKESNVQDTFSGVKIMLLASPCLILSHIFGTFFRSMGKKVLSSVGLSLLGVAQIVSAIILSWSGVEKLDSVIWGIAIGETLSFFFFLTMWIIFLFINKKCGLKGEKKNFERGKKFKNNMALFRNVIPGIIKSGLPSLARQGGISAGLWVTNLLAGKYSLEAQSVMTAANRFMTLPFGIIIAVCQAYQPIASRAEKAKEESEEEFIVARRFGLWMICIVLFGLFLAGKGILNMIPGQFPGKDTLLVIIGSQTMVLPAVMYSQLIITQFQVRKDWVAGTFLSVLRNALVFIPVLWLMDYFMGIWGLFLGQSISDLLVLPISEKVFSKRVKS